MPACQCLMLPLLRLAGYGEEQPFRAAVEPSVKQLVFITTSTFTVSARDHASKIENRVILIDGDLLGQLMIDHGVGVTTLAAYDLKRVDIDYFAEE